MARNIPTSIGRDRNQLVGNPGGLAALAQADYQKLSTLPGFQNISPIASQGGSYVFNPRDIRDLIRSQRGSPTLGAAPAPLQPAPAAPVAPGVAPPVALDRGYLPPAAQQQFNVMDQSTWKAYDPSLEMLKGNLRYGNKDTTGYLAEVQKATRALDATREQQYQNELSRMIEMGTANISGEDNSVTNAPSYMKSGLVLNPYTGQYESNASGLAGAAGSRARAKLGKTLAPDEAIRGAYASAEALRPAFEEKYLPKELMGQMQRMVDAGLDLSQLPNVKNNDQAIREIAAGLASRGITDFRQIGVATDDKGKTVYYDKKTGAPVSSGLIAFKEGEGNTGVYLTNKNGNVFIRPDYKKSGTTFDEWMDVAAPGIILGMAAGPAGAALGSAMGGGAAATVAGNALAYGTAGGATSAAQGGDFGKGFLTGAVGGAAGSLGTGAGQANVGQSILGSGAPAWQTAAINRGLQGALTGGLQAGMSGGNALQGALAGGLGNAVGGGLAALSGSNPLARVGSSALAGGLRSSLQGQDFGEGLKSGAISGATSLGRGFLSRMAGRRA